MLAPVRGGEALDEAYRALDGWFGVRGELERRAVVEDWLRTPEGREVGGVRMRYHLLVARTVEGALAAVRDCHVTVDPSTGVCVVYLAHALVLPEHRRTGLARWLRELPVELAREDLVAWGVGASEVVLAVEQEPVARGAEDTVIRLVAYGRSGFQVVSPEVLPYCQPDFRDVAALGVPARPLPLLAVARRVGHEGAPTLPAALAEAFVTHLYAVFSTHCREEDLRAPREHALGYLRRSGLAQVPLLPMPAAVDDVTALGPLSEESVLPRFPTLWTARGGLMDGAAGPGSSG